MAPLPDTVIAVLWLAATAFLAAAGWVTAARLFLRDTFLTRIGHTIVFAWANIVGVSTILGATGALWPAALLASVTGAAGLTLVIVLRRFRAPAATEGELHAPPNEPASGATRWLWNAVWVVWFAFWSGHVVSGGLLRFPDDWDTLMYHLPLVDHWLQARSLYAPAGLRWSDPGNNELVTLWLVAPFSGDFHYALTNLPATVLLACASVELGRQLGLSEFFRHVAGLSVVTNFVVFKQLIDTENDVAVAALFLACLAYTLRYTARGSAADLFFGVISLGLLSGVKYYALGYVVVLATAASLLILRRWGYRTAARAAILGLLGVLTFGGYWYVRNWVTSGSPLYPLSVTGSSDGLEPVYPGSVWSTTFLGNRRAELLELALNAVWGMTGPCHVAALLSLPITLTWLVVSGSQRDRRAKRPQRSEAHAARSMLAFLTVTSGLVLLVTPFAVEDVPGTLNQMHWMYCPIRYGLCFLSLAVLSFVLTLSDVIHGFRVWSEQLRGSYPDVVLSAARILQALLVAAVLFQFKGLMRVELVRSLEDTLLWAINFLLTGLIVCLMTHNWPRFRRALVVALSITVVSGLALGIALLARHWHHGFATYYDRMLAGGLFRHLANAQPQVSSICVLDLRAYPFFGSARQFRVCQPQQVRSRQELDVYLRSHEVVLVAARFDLNLTARGWQSCRTWLSEDPHLFVTLKGGHWPYTVYERRTPSTGTSRIHPLGQSRPLP